jgi:hypothetical protein
MEMAECKTSLRRQCPWDWLKTQAKKISKKNPQVCEKSAKLEVEAFD